MRAIDAETGETRWVIQMPEGGQALQPAVTADGRGLIVPEGGDNPGVVRMDAATGEVVWATRDLGRVAPGASPWVGNGGLRADGRYVVTTDSHVLTLDPDTGAILDATAWPEPMPYSEVFRVWPDGRVSREDPERAATGILFDPSHPERGATEIDGIPLSVSPDGSRVLLLGSTDSGTDLRVASTASPDTSSPWVRVTGFVMNAPWSPDGRRIALTTGDGLQLLDPESMRVGAELAGHSGAVMDARFTGTDGDMVWTAGRDGTAIAFDLSGQRTPIATRPADPQPHVGDSSVSAQRGVYLDYIDDAPNAAFVTDLATGRNLGTLAHGLPGPTTGWDPGTMFQPTSVAITPDGATAVMGVDAFLPESGPVLDRGAVVIFDALTQERQALVEVPWPIHRITVTPDGGRAVVSGHTGYAIVDIPSARLVGEPVPLEEAENIEWTEGASVSPDGRLAALARDDEVVLVDLASGTVARRGHGRQGGRTTWCRPSPGRPTRRPWSQARPPDGSMWCRPRR